MEACPGEVVTYTCTVTQTTILDWTAEPFVPSSSSVRFAVGTHNEQATQSCNDFPSIQCTDIDFLATLTSVGPVLMSVADLTSTFMFTATARLNGTVVLDVTVALTIHDRPWMDTTVHTPLSQYPWMSQ